MTVKVYKELRWTQALSMFVKSVMDILDHLTTYGTIRSMFYINLQLLTFKQSLR
jgi:hypothetical protein